MKRGSMVRVFDERGAQVFFQDPECEIYGIPHEYVVDGTLDEIINALEIALACAKALVDRPL